MKCPYCGNYNTRVIDSRPADDGSSIRRRRECDVCGRRFTTYEKVETLPVIVIKRMRTGRHMTVPRLRAESCAPAISARSVQTRSSSWWMMWRRRFLAVRRKKSPAG